jgi:hypothetical protein
VRKAPEFYSPLFPGVPDDLPYVWPGTDPDVLTDTVSAARRMPGDSGLWVFRPRNLAEFEEWTTTATVTLRDVSPLGKRGPKWKAQLSAFSALDEGAPIAVLMVGGESLLRGIVTGTAVASTDENGETVFRLPIELRDEVPRRAFAYPALLQDPRTLFSV